MGGSTGGVPVIVLAPKDVLDCYLLAVHAFNYAEEFRCPVFIASNKEIGLTRQSIDLDAVNLPSIIHRKNLSAFWGRTRKVSAISAHWWADSGENHLIDPWR